MQTTILSGLTVGLAAIAAMMYRRGCHRSGTVTVVASVPPIVPPVPPVVRRSVPSVATPVAPSAPVEGVPASFRAPSGRIKVLAVDDDPDVADIISILLGQLNCEVVVENAANPALARLQAGEIPDLIISDVRMPEKNGLEFACEVEAEFPHVPIVLMTGYSGDLLGQTVRWPVLHKPVSQHTLAQLIRPNGIQ